MARFQLLKKWSIWLAPVLIMGCHLAPKPTGGASEKTDSTITKTDSTPASTAGIANNLTINLPAGTQANKANALKAAYDTAYARYKAAKASGNAMPKSFTIKVNGSGMLVQEFGFQSAHLAMNDQIVGQINQFMDAVIQHRYNDLPKLMEPGVDLTQVINLFKTADAQGAGLKHSWFVALQDATGVKEGQKKPIPVIQGWVLVSDADTTEKSPVLFVVNPQTAKLSSVYLNPGASK